MFLLFVLSLRTGLAGACKPYVFQNIMFHTRKKIASGIIMWVNKSFSSKLHTLGRDGILVEEINNEKIISFFSSFLAKINSLPFLSHVANHFFGILPNSPQYIHTHKKQRTNISQAPSVCPVLLYTICYLICTTLQSKDKPIFIAVKTETQGVDIILPRLST